MLSVPPFPVLKCQPSSTPPAGNRRTMPDQGYPSPCVLQYVYYPKDRGGRDRNPVPVIVTRVLTDRQHSDPGLGRGGSTQRRSSFQNIPQARRTRRRRTVTPGCRTPPGSRRLWTRGHTYRSAGGTFCWRLRTCRRRPACMLYLGTWHGAAGASGGRGHHVSSVIKCNSFEW